MTPNQLQELESLIAALEALGEKATARPWQLELTANDGVSINAHFQSLCWVNQDEGSGLERDDAGLAAAAVNHLPAFLADVKRRIERVRGCKVCWGSGRSSAPEYGAEWDCTKCAQDRADLAGLLEDLRKVSK